MGLFKPKSKFSVSSTRVNISLQHNSIVEATGLWPEGVTCCKWHSVYDWREICHERNSEEKGKSQYDDVFDQKWLSLYFINIYVVIIFIWFYSNS